MRAARRALCVRAALGAPGRAAAGTFRALCGLFRLVGLGRCLGRLLFSGTAVGDLLLVFRDEAVGGFQRIHLDALLAQAVGGAGLQVVKGHVGHAVEVIE